MIKENNCGYLKVENLYKSFDQNKVLDGFSLTVEPLTISAIVGPNGAGKTTLFDVITGFLSPDAGSVYYGSKQLDSLPTYKISRYGVVRSFQGNRLISRLSVLDNILLAFQDQDGEDLIKNFFYRKNIKKIEDSNISRAVELLDVLEISSLKFLPVKSLSYGQQKMISFLCCIASGATLMLLDEPFAGVNSIVVNRILNVIKSLPSRGITVVIIEHNIDAIFNICDKFIYMESGVNLLEGSPEYVINHPSVVGRYIG